MHLAQHGKLTLDSKKIKGDLEDFLKKENRFNALTRKNPEASARLHHHLLVSRVDDLGGGLCTIDERQCQERSPHLLLHKPPGQQDNAVLLAWPNRMAQTECSMSVTCSHTTPSTTSVHLPFYPSISRSAG